MKNDQSGTISDYVDDEEGINAKPIYKFVVFNEEDSNYYIHNERMCFYKGSLNSQVISIPNNAFFSFSFMMKNEEYINKSIILFEGLPDLKQLSQSLVLELSREMISNRLKYGTNNGMKPILEKIDNWILNKCTILRVNEETSDIYSVGSFIDELGPYSDIVMSFHSYEEEDIVQLMYVLTHYKQIGFHLCVSVGENSLDDKIMISISDQASYFGYCLNRSHLVVLSTDAIAPFEDFEKDLGISFKEKIIPDIDDCLNQFVGCSFSTLNNEELLGTLETILKGISGGVILYCFLDNLSPTQLKQASLFSKIEKNIPVIYSNDSIVLSQFRKKTLEKGIALLITNNIQIMDPKDYFISSIIIICPQSIDGKLIRFSNHQMSKLLSLPVSSFIVFNSEKYQFEQFINERMENNPNPQLFSKRLKRMFTEYNASLPENNTYHKGKPAQFHCALCKEQAFSTPSIDSELETTFNRNGFLEITHCESDSPVLILRKKSTLLINGNTSQIIWSQNDMIGYQTITCKCGSILGAQITVVSQSTLDLVDKIVIIMSRLRFSNKIKSTRRLSQTGNRQKKLDF